MRQSEKEKLIALFGDQRRWCQDTEAQPKLAPESLFESIRCWRDGTTGRAPVALVISADDAVASIMIVLAVRRTVFSAGPGPSRVLYGLSVAQGLSYVRLDRSNEVGTGRSWPCLRFLLSVGYPAASGGRDFNRFHRQEKEAGQSALAQENRCRRERYM